MPNKVCPQCDAIYGARKLVCDCGHDFGCKRAGKEAVKSGDAPHPLYPEPGAWIFDKMKGMPDVDPPEPLPCDGLIDTVAVQEYVAYEGLGFAIYSLIPVERIFDSHLRTLWREARIAMQKVVEHLEIDS